MTPVIRDHAEAQHLARQVLLQLLRPSSQHEEGTSAKSRSPFAVIDHQLEDLTECRRLFDEEIAKQEVALRDLRNQAVPIHQLPVELFTDIIFRSLKRNDQWDGDRLRVLSRISKAWFGAITNNSLFWRTAHSDDSDYTHSLVLRKNTAGPLRLICSSADITRSEDVLTRFTPHSSRWESLLIADGHSSILTEYLSVPTPLLADLFVAIGEIEEMDHDPYITLSEGRSLRDVDLEGASLDWGLGRLARLQSLQIRTLKDTIPTLAQLQAMLTASPELQWLLLEDLVPRDGSGSTTVTHYSAPTTSIHLPRLETLCVSKVPREITEFLTSCISAPQCQYFHVRDVFASPSNRQPISQIITPILRSSLPVRLVFDQPAVGVTLISGTDERVPMRWIFDSDQPQGCVLVIKPLPDYTAHLAFWLNILPIPEVHLEIGPRRAAFHLDLLDLLLGITTLKIHQERDASAILQHLAQRSEDGSFPCPRLTELTALGAQVQDVVNLFEARQSIHPLERLNSSKAVIDALGHDALYPNLQTHVIED